MVDIWGQAWYNKLTKKQQYYKKISELCGQPRTMTFLSEAAGIEKNWLDDILREMVKLDLIKIHKEFRTNSPAQYIRPGIYYKVDAQ